MTHYELFEGSYYLKEDKPDSFGVHRIVNMSDEVAIGFSKGEPWCCLHKHGSPEQVQKWLERNREKYMAAGLIDEANSLAMISGKFPVEELNKCLDCTGYLDSMLKKFGFGGLLK